MKWKQFVYILFISILWCFNGSDWWQDQSALIIVSLRLNAFVLWLTSFLFFQKFPDEGLANVVRNVFDFDSYNKDIREVLITALHKHGIPIGAKPTSVHLAKE